MLLAGRRQRLDAAADGLERAVAGRLSRLHARVLAAERALGNRSPAATVAKRRERFDTLRGRLDLRFLAEKRGYRDELAERLEPTFARAVLRARHRFEVLRAQLGTVDPRAPLRRGFAIVRGPSGAPLVDPAEAPAGTRLRIEVARGELAARVEPEGTDGGKQIGLF